MSTTSFYLFLDAIYLKLRPDDAPSEGVLVCWGVTLEGRKVLLGLALGSRESYESWLAFGRDLIGRGLRAPALVVADGAPGIWKAVRELWPVALEQRCTIHGRLARREDQPQNRRRNRTPPPVPLWVSRPCDLLVKCVRNARQEHARCCAAWYHPVATW